MELIIPHCLDLPPSLVPSPPPHYYTARLTPAHFTQPLLRGYLGNDGGSLTALSLRANIGTDNVFAVLPNGNLYEHSNIYIYYHVYFKVKPRIFMF